MSAYQRLYVLLTMALCLMPATGAALIKSLQPMSALAPIGAMVKFTCVVNTTELNEEFFDIGWKVAGVLLSGGSNQAVISNGSLRIGTLQQRVSEDLVSGVPVQCAVLTINPSLEISVIRKSENATLTAYGETLLLCAFAFRRLVYMQVHLRHHQTSHQHSPVTML